jgi:hypothetical protein
MKIGLCICLAVLLFALAGCAQADHVVKIGYLGSESSTTWHAKFQSYNGTEHKAIAAKKGDVLILTYDLAVKTGQFSVVVQSKDGAQLFRANAGQAGASPPIAITQRCQLVLHGEAAKKGSFQLSWEVAPPLGRQ